MNKFLYAHGVNIRKLRAKIFRIKSYFKGLTPKEFVMLFIALFILLAI